MAAKNKSLLLVANWDSGTRYAWWLMESFWLQLGEKYANEGKNVFLVYPKISTLPAQISESQIDVKKLDFVKNDIKSLYAQYKFIRQYYVGTIYFSDFPSCSIKYLIFRLAGVRHIIVHEHVPGVRDVPRGLKRQIKRLVHRIPLICASGLLAATEYVRRRHIDVTGMPEERCYCAPNGLPEPVAVEAKDLYKQYGIPKDRLVMVTTGRASEYKGIDFALALLAELVHKKQLDVHYLFCGDGPDLDTFKELAKKLDVDDHVTFTGQVEGVTSYLKACDFAIHPSKGEVGYSLSILEYMQAGLPVVVPDNPSVCGATVDGVSGGVYREGDLQEAVDKVAQMLNLPESISSMGAKAEQIVLDDYRLSNTHERLLQAVNAIVKN